jgi:DNA-binding NtrC family response regulator
MARIFMILVIDDDKRMGETIAATLSGRGHQVVLANNVEHGVTELSQAKFDLLITDTSLPATEGFETLAQWGQVSEQLRVLHLAELKRPFSADELLDWVDYAIASGMPGASQHSDVHQQG